MQAPNKKSLIAAAAAPFALTLALGAAPAYAEGNGNQNQSGQPNASATTNANTNSTADIWLEGCTVKADKDISYVEFTLEDGSTKKIELNGGTSFDLSSADYDFVSVVAKAGTSVSESFSVEECSTTTGGSAGGTDDTDSGNDDEVDDGNDDDASGADAGLDEDESDVETGTENEVENEVENESGQDKIDENKDQQDDRSENAGGGRDNNDNSSDDDVAGAEANVGADVSGDVSAEVQGDAATGTPQGDADAVLGAEGETQAYQPTAADGSTQYLPNTGAEENAALIAGGAGLAGFGAWMMLKRRRFGLDR